jgi:hypothetical protein
LSRACLDKIIIFIYKWRKKTVFSPPCLAFRSRQRRRYSAVPRSLPPVERHEGQSDIACATRPTTASQPVSHIKTHHHPFIGQHQFPERKWWLPDRQASSCRSRAGQGRAEQGRAGQGRAYRRVHIEHLEGSVQFVHLELAVAVIELIKAGLNRYFIPLPVPGADVRKLLLLADCVAHLLVNRSPASVVDLLSGGLDRLSLGALRLLRAAEPRGEGAVIDLSRVVYIDCSSKRNATIFIVMSDMDVHETQNVMQ